MAADQAMINQHEIWIVQMHDDLSMIQARIYHLIASGTLYITG